MKLKFTITLCFIATVAFCQSPNFIPRGIGGGGALFAPSINPVNDNEFYVGCDMSELFHSTDFGNTHTQEHFQTIQGGHNSTMRFTAFVNVRYCIDYTGYTPQPVKSTTNGTSWNLLPGNPDPSEETYSIHADFNQPNHILISYYSQIYFSADGGNTFTLVHTAANSGAGILVGGVFFDGTNIFIGTNDGLIISNDNGNTFSLAIITGIPVGEAMYSFAGAKEAGNIRFFCLTANVNDVYAGLPGSDYWGLLQGVYSLDYGVGTWTPKMNGINIVDDFMMFVGMAQNDITNVYLAGSSSSNSPNIMKTLNGGSLWTHVFNTSNNQNINTGWCGYGGDRGWGYAESPFGFAVAPNNSNKLLFSDFGFVHAS
ncbi:MAG: WD40/YVTN/BNR-like repeat-containing protein, partial [Bacteroidia bacterium]